uniref:Putative salivary kunitz domain protein n=1 Tax=Ixodes ricinus TaxID=34613 RepID=A0A0K8RFX2_IXORI
MSVYFYLFKLVHTFPTAPLHWLALVSAGDEGVDGSNFSIIGARSQWHRGPALFLSEPYPIDVTWLQRARKWLRGLPSSWTVDVDDPP